MTETPHREFALIKVSDDEGRGEQFWIIRLDLVRGSLGRSESSVDAATARAHLTSLGCSAPEVDDLLRDARDVFRGVVTAARA